MDLVGELYATVLRRPDNPLSGIICLAAGTASGLRSVHAPQMFVMLQEAQGLSLFAYEACEMMAVGDAHLALSPRDAARYHAS